MKPADRTLWGIWDRSLPVTDERILVHTLDGAETWAEGCDAAAETFRYEHQGALHVAPMVVMCKRGAEPRRYVRGTHTNKTTR